MKLVNVLIGILLIILGICMVIYYKKFIKKGGLAVKLLGAGYGLIMIGIGLIIREF